MNHSGILQTRSEIRDWFRENSPGAVRARADWQSAPCLRGHEPFPGEFNFNTRTMVPDVDLPMPQRRFGIEIEGFFLARGNGEYLDHIDHIDRIMQQTGSFSWSIQQDKTIAKPLGSAAQSCGSFEFASPKLEGEAGLADYEIFAQALYRGGFRANNSCGLHLHVDQENTTLEQRINLAIAFQRNARTYASYIEPHRRADCWYSLPNPAVCEARLREAPSYPVLLNLVCPDRYRWFRLPWPEKQESAEYRGKEGQAFPCGSGYIRQLVRFTDAALDNPDARLPTLAELQAMKPRRKLRQPEASMARRGP